MRTRKPETRSDIMDIGSSIDAWLIAHIDDFSFAPSPEKSKKRVNSEFKCFCELAFLMRFLSQAPEDEFYKLAEAFLMKRIPMLDWNALLAHHADFLVGVLIVEDFYAGRTGLCFLDRTLVEKNIPLAAKVPYRRLEMFTYLMLRYGESAWREDFFSDQRETVLSLKLPLFSMSPMDLYSITHELMYWYLLRERGFELSAVFDMERLKHHLLMLTVLMSVEGNIDILGELLLCLKLFEFPLDRCEEDVVRQAWLKIRQNMIGGAVVADANIRERSRLTFEDLYHTTMVVKGAVSVWSEKK